MKISLKLIKIARLIPTFVIPFNTACNIVVVALFLELQFRTMSHRTSSRCNFLVAPTKQFLSPSDSLSLDSSVLLQLSRWVDLSLSFSPKVAFSQESLLVRLTAIPLQVQFISHSPILSLLDRSSVDFFRLTPPAYSSASSLHPYSRYEDIFFSVGGYISHILWGAPCSAHTVELDFPPISTCESFWCDQFSVTLEFERILFTYYHGKNSTPSSLRGELISSCLDEPLLLIIGREDKFWSKYHSNC